MAIPAHPSIAREIEGLDDLDVEALRLRWTELFAVAPLPRISRDLLIRGIAYRLQEEASAGLSKSTRRRLAQLAKELGKNGSLNGAQSASFKPGTKLIREWKGRVHEVVIAGDTYIYAGQHYRSLSQIARNITGTRWSGPRFFGLEAERPRRVPKDCDAAATNAGSTRTKTRFQWAARRQAGVADG